jgi:hypothetical protein
MTKRELLQMALDALSKMSEQSDCDIDKFTFSRFGGFTVIDALRAELAKPEPEPAGYFVESRGTQFAKYGWNQVADQHSTDADVIPLYRKEDL